MKPILGAAALLVAAWPAVAADLQRSVRPLAPIAPAVGYTWSGAYLGLNLGHLWAETDSLATAPRGVAGGIQAGYNWQYGQFVVGGEADIQGSGADDRFAPYKFSNPWFGTVRARLGYAFNNVLLYATVGLAYGGGRLEIAGLSETDAHVGWSSGGGVEVGLTPNWSTKAEYVFIGLSNNTYVLSGAGIGLDAHLARLGINYRF
jgi:outer membrane immunogenic protein